ncbi:MAG: hypothetical protein ABFD25_05710 [Clostridiaceae bacterium]
MKKGFILGFVCAALLFTAIGATAAQYTLTPSTVKFYMDGTEIKDDKLPLLYMEPGYNYLPAAMFRSICDKIGIVFEYVEKDNAIVIDTKTTALAETPEVPPNVPVLTTNTEAKQNSMVLSVKPISATTIEIKFASAVDKTVMENPANYVIAEKYGKKTALSVSLAVLDEAGTKVTLTTSEQKGAILYSIGIQDVFTTESKGYCGMVFVGVGVN